MLAVSSGCPGRADGVAERPAAASEAEPLASRLTVRTRDGPVSFAVELAETPEEQERGLMYRRHLDGDAGMLFDFGETRVVTMWMKNTYIPLDMLFIDENGVVAGIAADTVPMSREILTSPVPVRAVLEINAGLAARHGIRPGDRIDHPMFASPSAPLKPPGGGR